ncbi:MAG: ABC transporter ATP-binding protein, partial [Clostridiaceae bacterium]|nr:ABC transporter ATP-binding protein [Clostridiaceae bacterium]
MKKINIMKQFMGKNILRYFFAILFSGIAVLISVFNPLIVSFTVDSIIIGSEPIKLPGWLMQPVMNFGGKEALAEKLWILGLIYVLLTLMAGLFQYLRGRWISISTENAAKKIRDTIYDHLQHMEYSEHIKSQTGDLLQRSTTDVETVRKYMANQIPQVGEILFTVIITLITMLSINVKLTLYSLCVVPLIFITSIIFFTKVKKTFRLVEESDSELHTTLQENLTGVR